MIELANYWDWNPVSSECPNCGAAIPTGSENAHITWHYLTNTVIREVPTPESE